MYGNVLLSKFMNNYRKTTRRKLPGKERQNEKQIMGIICLFKV